MHAANPSRLKTFLWNYCPPLFHLGRYLRRTRHQARMRRIAAQLPPLRQAFLDRFGFVVQGGPFRGMHYQPQTHTISDAVLPRLIGSYEAQTHDAIATALGRAPSVIVDVGCEEGFCAVGLALQFPQGKTYAFDIEPWAQEACRKLAVLNGVAERLVIGGACTCQTLQELLPANAFVFCDCEGFEYDLLDPEQVPALRTADVLVELHDFVRMDLAITPAILARFRDSHEVSLFAMGEREPSRYPCLECLPTEQRQLATHEERMPGQQWAFLKARVRSETAAPACPGTGTGTAPPE